MNAHRKNVRLRVGSRQFARRGASHVVVRGESSKEERDDGRLFLGQIYLTASLANSIARQDGVDLSVGICPEGNEDLGVAVFLAFDLLDQRDEPVGGVFQYFHRTLLLRSE